jgi:hypothetical protein
MDPYGVAISGLAHCNVRTSNVTRAAPPGHRSRAQHLHGAARISERGGLETARGLPSTGRMKTTIVAALAVLGAGCSVVVGSGTTVTEERDVREFRGLAVQSGLKAQLTVGPRAVWIKTDDNLIRFIETKLENGILVIRMQQDVQLAPKFFEATIRAPELASIDISGGAIVEGEVRTRDAFTVISSGQGTASLSGIDTAVLQIDASGGSHITATGKAFEEVFKASAASRLDFGSLQARLLELDVSGGSFVTARASDQVRGALSGESQLQMRGTPLERTVALSGGSFVETNGP